MKKKRNILIIVLVVILFVIGFKILVGHIDIKLSIPYNNPIYRLQLNNEYYGMNMEMDYKINIIPKTITLINASQVYTYPSKVILNFGDEIKLNITGYNCYLNSNNKEEKIACTNYNHKIMKEIKNIKFTKMKIMGGSLIGITNNIIYDGNYNSDLTNLITNKGIYDVEILLEHDSISSLVEFLIEIE